HRELPAHEVLRRVATESVVALRLRALQRVARILRERRHRNDQEEENEEEPLHSSSFLFVNRPPRAPRETGRSLRPRGAGADSISARCAMAANRVWMSHPSARVRMLR